MSLRIFYETYIKKLDHKSLFFPNKTVFNLPAFKSFVLTTFNFILQMLEKRLSVPDEQFCACVVNHNNRHFPGHLYSRSQKDDSICRSFLGKIVDAKV